MSNKLPYIIGGGILLLLIGFLAMGSQKNSQQQNTNIVQSSSPIASNSVNATLSQDPQDIVPGLYKNPIQNISMNEGFKIESITVENNTDATGKTVSDHLELTLKNTAGKDLTDFQVYYTITDPTTKKKEGYYKMLTGFTLKNGETKHINFDNKQGTGHFSVNRNSIYYTSGNKLSFDVMVSTPGYKIQTAQAEKSAGGAELKD